MIEDLTPSGWTVEKYWFVLESHQFKAGTLGPQIQPPSNSLKHSQANPISILSMLESGQRTFQLELRIVLLARRFSSCVGSGLQ